MVERSKGTRRQADKVQLTDLALDGTLEEWPAEPPRPPRNPLEATRLALIDTPSQIHRLAGAYSDVGRATRIASTFKRSKPSKSSPTATGRFDARAFFDPDEHKWRVAARYLPADTGSGHDSSDGHDRR